ncbi:MAG TPA: glycosyltransferase family 4 protein [Bacteroidales bacterium]|nr:glycosyltransferase family 4 protein [Bacteroidales bacterium]
MIRVLRILNRFNLGGPTYNASYLSAFLPGEFETMLIGGKNDPTEKNSEYIPCQFGIKPVILDNMRREVNPVKDLAAYLQLLKIIKNYRPHIVHTHASKAGALGRLASKQAGVPVVLHTFHGHVFDGYFGKTGALAYRNIERLLAGISDGIIAISQAQKHDLANKYKICQEDKIRIIPLGFDLDRFTQNREEKRDRFRNEYRLEPNEVAIGIIGRLVPVKNHALFLEAIKIVKEKSKKPIRVFIVGDGESRLQTEQTAKLLNLDYTDWSKQSKICTITFTGWITEMDWLMAGMDIIALSSINEGTPVSLIEAQAAGKAIVTTNVGGISNVVIPDKTALLSDNYSPGEFAGNLLRLTENDGLREEMGRLGWDSVSKKFSYRRLVDETASYYHELLESKKVNVKNYRFV